MFLACDIGNSRIKTGIFSGDNLINSLAFNNVEQVIDLYSDKDISFTGISSVVPERSARLLSSLDSKSFPFHLISSESKLNLRMKYRTPESLGSDRLCSAEGAYLMNGKMRENEIIVTIDFGTATTINIVEYPGAFIGGVIAPGINMMGEALHSYTASLPEAEVSEFNDIIGDSTKSSIASGLLNSSLGLINRVLDTLNRRYSSNTQKIFITGGNAEMLIPFLDFNYTYEKNLVLYGIKAITSLNSPV
ncbi:MAG TPA: type III pantothenate kinase [Ignavibacteriaceae bacterium]